MPPRGGGWKHQGDLGLTLVAKIGQCSSAQVFRNLKAGLLQPHRGLSCFMSVEHNSDRLARHPGEQGARPSGVDQPEVEKFTTGFLSNKQSLTLADFIPADLTTENAKKRKSNTQSNLENKRKIVSDSLSLSDSGDSSSEMEFEKVKPKTPKFWPKFLVMSGEDEKFRRLHAIAAQKGIEGLCGEPKSIKRLRSGDLLIEVKKDSQSRSLLSAFMIHGCQVKVTEHRSLNYCKGVIHSHDNLTCPEEEIQEYLAPIGVTAVHRIVNRNGPTPTLVITFQGNTLPSAIKLGYEHCRVSPYIPNPLRCYVCQKFGHHGKSCSSKTPVCGKCSSKEHTSNFKNPCHNPEKCANCSGSHPAFSRSCPLWIQEQQVQQLKIQQNLTFQQARKLVQERLKGVSYATVAAKPVISVRNASTQTCDRGTQTEEPQTPMETQATGPSNNEIQNSNPSLQPKPQTNNVLVPARQAPSNVNKPPLPVKPSPPVNNNPKAKKPPTNKFHHLAHAPAVPPPKGKTGLKKIEPPP